MFEKTISFCLLKRESKLHNLVNSYDLIQLCKFKPIIFACVTIIQNILNLMPNNYVTVQWYSVIHKSIPPVKYIKFIRL